MKRQSLSAKRYSARRPGSPGARALHNQKKALGFLVGVLGITGGVGGLAYTQMGTGTSCLSESGSSLTILLDVSDPLGPNMRGEVLDQIQKAILDTEKGDLVNVATLTSYEGGVAIKWVYNGCAPSTELNPLIEAPKAHSERITAYVDGVKAALEQGLIPDSKPKSPIVEGLAEISSSHHFNSKEKRKLLLVTDLLQHTQVSFHSTTAFPLDPMETKYLQDFAPDLTNTEVAVSYLLRPPYRQFQTPELVEWMMQYLRSNGATGVVFDEVR